MKNTILISTLVGIFSLMLGTQVQAGTLYPTTPVGESMYSLEEIYDLITASTTSSEANGATIVVPGTVTPTMRTLTELYNAVLVLRNSNTGGTTTGTSTDSGTGTTTPPVPGEPALIVEEGSVSKTAVITDADNTMGTFTIKFNVNALEEDFYISEDGFDFVIEGATTSIASAVVLSSTADETNGVYEIKEGDTEKFSLKVNVSDVKMTGAYKLVLNSIKTTQNSDGVTGLIVINLNDEFETQDLSLNLVEDINDHSNIEVTLKDTVGNIMHVFIINIEAINEDIYVKKDTNVDYILYEGQLAKNAFDSVTTSYDQVGVEIVGEYFKVPAGQTLEFIQQVKLKNNSVSVTGVDVALDKLDYKVGFTNSRLRTLDLDENIFNTSN